MTKRRPMRSVKVPHRKGTENCESVRMPTPELVTIPMSMHMGAPATPVVKAGDEVYVGTLIGSMTGGFSVPVHSSVSGKVTAVGELLLISGATCATIIIESDGRMQPDPAIKKPEINGREDFVAAVRDSGLVGLGGAGFPAHIKLSPKTHVDTLLVNAAECEPYITSDCRTIMEDSEWVFKGIAAIRKYLEIERVVVGIEANKPEPIKLLKEKCSEFGAELSVLPSTYPKGAEKVLIYESTGRVVGEGMLPSDVGVLVVNITSAAFIGKLLESGMPLVEKRVTVDGDAVAEPKNVIAPIGTRIRDIMDFCGGYKLTPKKILMGGPMMGSVVYNDSYPMIKNNNALLAFSERYSDNGEESPCIRCGRCVRTCPFNLRPAEIDRAYERKDVERLKELKVNLCMECGCCAYMCPAKRDLVMTNKLAKALLRKEGGKK